VSPSRDFFVSYQASLDQNCSLRPSLGHAFDLESIGLNICGLHLCLGLTLTTRAWDPLEAAGQQAEEGLLEGSVEDGVNDGIEDAGGVAEPEEPLVEQLLEVARRAESHGEVHREERSPADEEQHEHRAEHLDRLALSLDGPQRTNAWRHTARQDEVCRSVAQSTNLANTHYRL